MNTALQRLLLFGIVIVVTGCDNVEWGGIDVSLRSPSDSLVSDRPPAAAEVVGVAREEVRDHKTLNLFTLTKRVKVTIPIQM